MPTGININHIRFQLNNKVEKSNKGKNTTNNNNKKKKEERKG